MQVKECLDSLEQVPCIGIDFAVVFVRPEMINVLVDYRSYEIINRLDVEKAAVNLGFHKGAEVYQDIAAVYLHFLPVFLDYNLFDIVEECPHDDDTMVELIQMALRLNYIMYLLAVFCYMLRLSFLVFFMAFFFYPFGILLNPIFAAIAMASSSISVVGNAMLLNRYKPRI